MSLNSASKIISVTDTKWKNLIFERYHYGYGGRQSYKNISCNRCSHFKALNQDRFDEKTFCDFTIATETRRFPVHKCVIGVASEFFKKAITTEMKEKYENFVTVNNVCPDTMEMVLNHIYGEEVSITNENIDHLFAASDYLEIFTLNSACVEYISKTEINEENYLAVWIFAQENNFQDLLQRCINFVEQNFVKISEEKLFLSISTSYIESFLARRGASFPENTFFELISKWVEYDKENRKDQFAKLFELVNLDDLDPEYVTNTVSEHELVLNNLECLQKVMKIVRKTAKAASSVTDEILFMENHNDELKIKTYRHINTMFYKKEEFIAKKSSHSFYRWQKPLCLQDQALTMAKGVLYGMGGCSLNNLNSCTDVACLNFVTKITEERASMTQKRSRFGCALLGNSIYVAGGQAHKTEILDSVECYSISDNSWTIKSSMHHKRAGCCLVAHKNCLYVLGGDTHLRSRSSRSVEKFDGYKWSMIESMSETKCDFAAVVLNNEIYAIAGYSPEAVRNISGKVEVYSICEGSWEFIASLNHPRKGHSACVAGGKIYVAGGTDRWGKVTPVEVYDPIADDNGWKVLGDVSNSEYVAVFDAKSV